MLTVDEIKLSDSNANFVIKVYESQIFQTICYRYGGYKIKVFMKYTNSIDDMGAQCRTPSILIQ